ncbi:Spo0E family sporulation regulatory protein-aspartic acid phosphatase [Gorillibacterium sp. sgz5001074]|uniref:Spo0E family sporulation regulatory protein-aspartic acid phosphatase n=1 Tax=Gorillibacterium sp. sgz5001074 TaxID=3446695 RepID=UPI003F67743E
MEMCVACLEPIEDIVVKIENKRSLMNRLADELGIVHPAVMRASQQLDELLLQYYSIARSFQRGSAARAH